MSRRVVIKFGGADLSTGEKIKQAAEMVAEAPFEEKIVVEFGKAKLHTTCQSSWPLTPVCLRGLQ